MYLKHSIESVFNDLQNAILQMKCETYRTPCRHLFGATIGQHVRHIIELFQCLLTGADTGIVNYEKRERNIEIEQDPILAISLLRDIVDRICTENKTLTLHAAFGSDEELVEIDSNYFRELAYNLEHTIHHMALIRVGINEVSTIKVTESFGVAPSTIQYRKHVHSNVPAIQG